MSSQGKRDYYEILEVDRGVSAEELKRAYRRAAARLHPDRNPDDQAAEEAFKRVTEAYAVLSDPHKRRRYNQTGHAGFPQDPQGTVDFSAFGEILEGIFGDVWGRRTGSSRTARDLRYDLTITFAEAARGVERDIRVRRSEVCSDCDGEGAQPGSSSYTCPSCEGRGHVRQRRGLFATSRPCDACGGQGKRPERPCARCAGAGLVHVDQALDVRIPAGVEDGAVRTLRGAGEHTKSGTGNLHVHIHVADHPLFRRDGADVLCEVPLSFPQAALGAQIDVPTVDGSVKMKVPAGTQSGRVFRLRGKGFPVFGGYGKGDQLVTVVVEVPTGLTDRQKVLLQQLALEMSTATHPQQQSFLDKLRSWLG